jgi:ATP-dependent Clp protease, protease subunit
VKELLTDMLAKHCGQPRERVLRDSDRDYFMSAMQAKEYGLVDNVIEKHLETKSDKEKEKER